MFSFLHITGYPYGAQLYWLLFKCAIVNAVLLGIMAAGITVGVHLAWSLT